MVGMSGFQQSVVIQSIKMNESDCTKKWTIYVSLIL